MRNMCIEQRKLVFQVNIRPYSQGNGFTAAHVAALKDRPDILDALLRSGASVSARTARGSTALHLACSEGLAGCVRALLRHGADMAALTNVRFRIFLCFQSNAPAAKSTLRFT